MIELRDYQREAVERLLSLSRKRPFLLLQAATGAGKTLMASSLMRRLSEAWGFRCLFLAHRAVLVRQALGQLRASFQDLDLDVDCLCASLQKPGQVLGNIVVSSPKTLAMRLAQLPNVDFLVVDECHRVPPRGRPSLYADVFQAVEARRPGARVLGITATPWRLGQGAIHGPGEDRWWSGLDCRISMASLQEKGWLAPLSCRIREAPRELASLPVGASGDYQEEALEAALLRPLHLGSAVAAVESEARDRTRIAAFCVTVAHARALAARFREAGIPAAAGAAGREGREHGCLRRAVGGGRRRGRCSGGMLTEGWDCPATDCLLLCRPTLSPALYVQMVGRGLRTAPGKRDCLLLDLAGNVLRHGSPNEPRLGLEPEGEASSRSRRREAEDPARCPFCGALRPEGGALSCPSCEAPLFELEEGAGAFRELDLARLERLVRRGEELRKRRLEEERAAREAEKARVLAEREERGKRRAALVNGGEPFEAPLLSCSEPWPTRVGRGPAAGALVLGMELLVLVPGLGRVALKAVLDPEGAMGRRHRSCWWAFRETMSFWEAHGAGPFPASAAGLLRRWRELPRPETLLLRQGADGRIRPLWKAPKGKEPKERALKEKVPGEKAPEKRG